jgi:cob(I)alamin adenosyltransferase
MVYLSRIYTKTGDQGETGLGDGTRVAKNHPRVAACGSVDELNAVLGMLLACAPDLGTTTSEPPISTLLRDIQNDLFDVGADLCVPQAPDEKSEQGGVGPGAQRRVLRMQPVHAARLEAAIDHWNASLAPLTSFVLPGGSSAAAWCHLARTVCRRAERDLVTLAQSEPINPHALIYLNRLSDLLFVLARIANSQGQQDVLWKPGKSLKI